VEDERVDFTSVATYQDGTAISAFAFDRRIRSFQHWRRLGHRFNDKRRRNDLEGLLLKGEHCRSSTYFPAITQFNFGFNIYTRVPQTNCEEAPRKTFEPNFHLSSIELIDAAENGWSREP
jgi:hypothetical protein